MSFETAHQLVASSFRAAAAHGTPLLPVRHNDQANLTWSVVLQKITLLPIEHRLVIAGHYDSKIDVDTVSIGLTELLAHRMQWERKAVRLAIIRYFDHSPQNTPQGKVADLMSVETLSRRYFDQVCAILDSFWFQAIDAIYRQLPVVPKALEQAA